MDSRMSNNYCEYHRHAFCGCSPTDFIPATAPRLTGTDSVDQLAAAGKMGIGRVPFTQTQHSPTSEPPKASSDGHIIHPEHVSHGRQKRVIHSDELTGTPHD